MALPVNYARTDAEIQEATTLWAGAKDKYSGIDLTLFTRLELGKMAATAADWTGHSGLTSSGGLGRILKACLNVVALKGQFMLDLTLPPYEDFHDDAENGPTSHLYIKKGTYTLGNVTIGVIEGTTNAFLQKDAPAPTYCSVFFDQLMFSAKPGIHTCQYVVPQENHDVSYHNELGHLFDFILCYQEIVAFGKALNTFFKNRVFHTAETALKAVFNEFCVPGNRFRDCLPLRDQWDNVDAWRSSIAAHFGSLALLSSQRDNCGSVIKVKEHCQRKSRVLDGADYTAPRGAAPGIIKITVFDPFPANRHTKSVDLIRPENLSSWGKRIDLIE